MTIPPGDRGRLKACSGAGRHAGRFLRDRRGNIGALTALLLIPLIGVMAMATEASGWFLVRRAVQNAADSAAIAAATNGGNGGTDYSDEGMSVASNYGFTNNADNTTVAVTYSTSSVPACASTSCYSVTITKNMPLYFVNVVGYNGNVAIGPGRGQSISAIAVATTKTVNAPFCLLAMSTGSGIASSVASSNITCNVMTNGNSNCGGNMLTSGYSDSVGNSNDCSLKEHTGVPVVTDPYVRFATRAIPSHSCLGTPGYYQETDPNWPGNVFPAGNTLNSSATMTANQVFCGDVQLASDVIVTTASPGTVLYILNGTLDLHGHTLRTAAGSALTIVFTSPNPSVDQYTSCVGATCSLAVTNYPTGGGGLNINAPVSGIWAGMAIYQNSNMPAQPPLTYSGNWNITGIVDLSITDFTANAAVNQSTNGYSCFALVVNTMTISSGDFFYPNAQSQCAQAGVVSPTSPAYFVGQLVR